MTVTTELKMFVIGGRNSVMDETTLNKTVATELRKNVATCSLDALSIIVATELRE
jgi:hypothetical protein